MANEKVAEPLASGTYVKIHHSGFGPVQIAEYRGPLGPGGCRIYRILVDPEFDRYTEVREDQIEVLPG